MGCRHISRGCRGLLRRLRLRRYSDGARGGMEKRTAGRNLPTGHQQIVTRVFVPALAQLPVVLLDPDPVRRARGRGACVGFHRGCGSVARRVPIGTLRADADPQIRPLRSFSRCLRISFLALMVGCGTE